MEIVIIDGVEWRGKENDFMKSVVWVSENGDVKTGGINAKPRKFTINDNGWYGVSLHRYITPDKKIGSSVPVADLVCEYFNGAKPDPYYWASHKDGNNTNNHKDNVEWVCADDYGIEWRLCPLKVQDRDIWVSEQGHIRVDSKYSQDWHQGVRNNGYMNFTIKIDNKSYANLSHRFIALAFVENPNPEKFKLVNHKDGDKTNNHKTNLEWCDHEYNNRHARETGLMNSDHNKVPIILINIDTGIEMEFDGLIDCARWIVDNVKDGITRKADIVDNSISRLLRGDRKRYLRFKARYKNI